MNNRKASGAAIIIIIALLAFTVHALAGTINLLEENNNENIAVIEGEEFVISLAGNPSTGYQWLYSSSAEGILKEINHYFQQSSNVPGAGGIENWVFQAAAPGSAKLTFTYSRPWESKPPEKVLIYNITVTPKVEHPRVNIVVTDQVFKDAGIIENNRVLVPLRALAEALMFQVDWSASARVATIKKDALNLEVAIGGNIAFLNNTPLTMDIPAKIIANKTYVPVRFVSEALGVKIHWDDRERIVYVGGTDVTFTVYDGTAWVTPKKLTGEWHRSGSLPYQDFAVVRSATDYLSMPPLKTLLPIAPPPADYQKYVVFWAYLGEATSGGHDIAIERIELQHDLVYVTVKRISPPPGSINTAVMSYPQVSAQVERKLLPDNFKVLFVDEKGVVLKTIY